MRETRTPAQVDALVSKLRVYSISDQDNAGPWIRREFPNLSYIVKPSTPNGEEYDTATWTGIAGDVFYANGDGADFTTVTNEWLDENIRSKGPLGQAYPQYLFIMEGDTPSFFSLINSGLASWMSPSWGGWGGRYVYRQPYGENDAIWTQGGDAFDRGWSKDTVVGNASAAFGVPKSPQQPTPRQGNVMFSTTIKRSVATLGVVAGLLAAAGPAASAGPGGVNDSAWNDPLVVKGAAPTEELFGNDNFSAEAEGTQVGSEGVKAPAKTDGTTSARSSRSPLPTWTEGNNQTSVPDAIIIFDPTLPT